MLGPVLNPKSSKRSNPERTTQDKISRAARAFLSIGSRYRTNTTNCQAIERLERLELRLLLDPRASSLLDGAKLREPKSGGKFSVNPFSCLTSDVERDVGNQVQEKYADLEDRHPGVVKHVELLD
jgi:hypothetical protein